MSSSALTKIISLNVGGRTFSTTLTTLLSHPDSVLAKMFTGTEAAAAAAAAEVGMPPAMRDGTGAYFIDRDPETFAVILNYLRTGKVHLTQGVSRNQLKDEALYYGLGRLAEDVDAIDKEQGGTKSDDERQILVVEVKGQKLCG
jgi:hypothetical protein